MTDKNERQTTSSPTGAARPPGNTVRAHLHLDGLALLAGAIYAYSQVGGSWWLFVLLLLAPDVFMLGYLKGPVVGAVLYNAGHTLLIPLFLTMAGTMLGAGVISNVGIIWAAHIGMDRALGYGYKYPTDFRDNHIERE